MRGTCFKPHKRYPNTQQVHKNKHSAWYQVNENWSQKQDITTSSDEWLKLERAGQVCGTIGIFMHRF